MTDSAISAWRVVESTSFQCLNYLSNEHTRTTRRVEPSKVHSCGSGRCLKYNILYWKKVIAWHGDSACLEMRNKKLWMKKYGSCLEKKKKDIAHVVASTGGVQSQRSAILSNKGVDQEGGNYAMKSALLYAPSFYWHVRLIIPPPILSPVDVQQEA